MTNKHLIRFQIYSLENIGWKSKKNVQKVDDIIFEKLNACSSFILKVINNK